MHSGKSSLVLFRRLSVGAIAMSAAACSTSLHVVSDPENISRLYPRSKNKAGEEIVIGPVQGIVYYLPETVIDFEVTRRLDTCKIEINNSRKREPIVEFAVSISSTEKFRADKSRPYFIDYSALENGLKEIDLTATFFENGTLKSLNAQITDKTAEAFSDFLQGSIRIAKMAVGLPSAGPRPGVTALVSPCREPIVTALTVWKEKIIEKRDSQRELDVLIARTPNTADEISRISELKDRLKELDPIIQRELNAISWTERYIWDVRQDDDGRFSYQLAPKRIDKFASLFEDSFWSVPDNKQNIIEQLSNGVLVVKQECLGQVDCIALPDVSTNAKNHLIYRAPAEATLFVCETACEVVSPDQLPEHKTVLLEKIVEMPQAGFHAAIPFKNEMFDGQTLSVSFRASGAIEEFKYASKAQLAAAAKAFNDATMSTGELVDSLSNEELTKIQAETALLKAKAERMKAQQALDEIGSTSIAN